MLAITDQATEALGPRGLITKQAIKSHASETRTDCCCYNVNEKIHSQLRRL